MGALIADRYEVIAPLGVGAMGVVHHVLDRELDEEVALKFLRTEFDDSPEMLARFRLEVKLARRVTHSNVARTFDLGVFAGQRFLTMERAAALPLVDVTWLDLCPVFTFACQPGRNGRVTGGPGLPSRERSRA